MYGDFYIQDDSFYQITDWLSLSPAVQGLIIGLWVMAGLICLTMLILLLVGLFKAFKKASQPGWAALVPFYNLFTLVKISGLELWWFILLTILPALNNLSGIGYTVDRYETPVIVHGGSWLVSASVLVMLGFLNYKIAKSFGKGRGFAVGLTLLPPIFWMMLGCSPDVKYLGTDGPYQIKYPKAGISKKSAK